MSLAFSKQSLSAEGASKVISGAQAKAGELGIPASIAVVDEAGVLKAMLRMDGASLISVDVAMKKAYTSAAAGFPTAEFFEFIKGDPPLLAGIPHVPGVSIIGGGIPLSMDGAVVGAIGISGGHYTQDIEIAQAGVAAAGL